MGSGPAWVKMSYDWVDWPSLWLQGRLLAPGACAMPPKKDAAKPAGFKAVASKSGASTPKAAAPKAGAAALKPAAAAAKGKASARDKSPTKKAAGKEKEQPVEDPE
eukprot:1236293-Prymnesium_polylepis.1